ncbi:MAG: hypothetical protein ACLR0U_16805 [Enterocloster clostridioformis]
MTTAQPLNKNEAVTFTYRFRTLERRVEAVTLWVKRIEGRKIRLRVPVRRSDRTGAEGSDTLALYSKIIGKAAGRE